MNEAYGEPCLRLNNGYELSKQTSIACHTLSSIKPINDLGQLLRGALSLTKPKHVLSVRPNCSSFMYLKEQVTISTQSLIYYTSRKLAGEMAVGKSIGEMVEEFRKGKTKSDIKGIKASDIHKCTAHTYFHLSPMRYNHPWMPSNYLAPLR